jgi:hypothetical protein
VAFFTLGGALSRVWRPAYPLLPWALTSAVLMVSGTWDHMVDGSAIEWTAVGLSAYELMMGLLRTSQAVPVRLTGRPDVSATASTFDTR